MRINISPHWEYVSETVNSHWIWTTTYYDPVKQLHIVVYHEHGSSQNYDDLEDFV